MRSYVMPGLFVAESHAGERHFIFSGANERALVALCRAFARRGQACSIAARPGPDPIRYTRYRAWIEAERSDDALDLADMLRCVRRIVARHPAQRLIFLPTAESVNRWVLRHREAFEQAGLSVPLVDEAVYLAISDKASLLTLAARFGLELPPALIVPDPLALPLVAKPRYEFEPDSGCRLYPELIFERTQLEHFLAVHDPHHYFFQHYLDGASYYYLAHFDRTGRSHFAYQRNLLQQANGKSILAAELCRCPNTQVQRQLEALFGYLGYHGYAMIELMELDGHFYLIEVNPRFWGPWALADRAGFLPEACDGRALETNDDCSGSYFWLGGWLADRRAGRSLRRYPAMRRTWLPALLGNDVYLRPDSLSLFLRELFRRPSARAVTSFTSGFSPLP